MYRGIHDTLSARVTTVPEVRPFFMLCPILLLMLYALTIPGAVSAQNRDERSLKYLFVDDRWIESSYEITRAVPEPVKEEHNPVLIADKPWESGVNLYGTVLFDDGRFRMWYQVYNSGAEDPRYRTAVAYAESRDGIRWEKPSLGMFDYEGEPTNIVLLSHGTSALYSPAVIKDADDPDASRRYKMLYWDSMSEKDLETTGPNFPLGTDVPGWRAIPGEGFFASFSPDGLHWTNAQTQPVFTCACDASSLSIAPDGSYQSYFKISIRDDRHFRVLGHSQSTDFLNWSDPRIILEPDWRDAYGTEFYGMATFPYQGNYLGLIWMYYNAPSDKHLDIQLATMTAEGAWQRAGDRKVFLPTGKHGDWDAGGIYTASTIVESPPGHEDEIYLYYGGTSVTHDDARYREFGIGMARFRLDGFAAMQAKQFYGYFETVPVTPDGSSLFLNTDATQGYVWVEAVDVLTGRSTARSHRIEGKNGTRAPVKWRHEGLGTGESVRLRFHMQKASVFSFWFED